MNATQIEVDSPATASPPVDHSRWAGRQLVGNVLAMLMVQAVSWSLTFAVNLFVPRYLGSATMGILFQIVAIQSLIELSHGLGHGTYVVKTAARTPHQVGGILTNTAMIRLAVGGLSLVILPFALTQFGYSSEFVYLAVLAVMGGICLSLNDLLGSGFQGLQWVRLGSWLTIAFKILMAVVTLLLVLTQRPVVDFVASGMWLGLIGVGGLTLILWRRGYRLAWPSRDGIRRVFIGSLPFALSGATIVAYLQLNPLLLGRLADAESVAWYGLAIRLSGTLMFLPGLLIGASMPVMSRLYVTSPEAMLVQARRLLLVFLICSTQPALLFWFYGHDIATLLFGPEFVQVGGVMQVLGLALVATYLNTYVGSLLAVMDRQRIWATVMITVAILALGINAGAILLAQPSGHAAVGAAIGFLITELAMTVPGFVVLSRYQLGRVGLIVLGKTALVTLVAAGLLALLNPLSPFLAIPVAAIGYLAVAWRIQLVPPEEIKLVLGLVEARLNRLLRGR
jgi:O-antigen/teichoic acid export membrane protein